MNTLTAKYAFSLLPFCVIYSIFELWRYYYLWDDPQSSSTKCFKICMKNHHVEGQVQDCNALVMEILQSCTKPGGWPMFISFLKDFRRLRVVIQKWIRMHISYFLIHVWLRQCDTSKYPAHYVALNFEGSWCERNGEMGSAWCAKIHDDFMKWKHFRRNWPFVRGIHRRRGALMFSVICAWINGWLNNGEAGVYRHHRAHYDVIVMVQGERFNVNYQRQFHVEKHLKPPF